MYQQKERRTKKEMKKKRRDKVNYAYRSRRGLVVCRSVDAIGARISKKIEKKEKRKKKKKGLASEVFKHSECVGRWWQWR